MRIFEKSVGGIGAALLTELFKLYCYIGLKIQDLSSKNPARKLVNNDMTNYRGISKLAAISIIPPLAYTFESVLGVISAIYTATRGQEESLGQDYRVYSDFSVGFQ